MQIFIAAHFAAKRENIYSLVFTRFRHHFMLTNIFFTTRYRRIFLQHIPTRCFSFNLYPILNFLTRFSYFRPDKLESLQHMRAETERAQLIEYASKMIIEWSIKLNLCSCAIFERLKF